MNKIFRLASLSALAVSGQAAAGGCFHYDLPEVEIVGRVTRVPLPIARAPSAELSNTEYSWYFEPAKPLCIAAGAENLGNTPIHNASRFEVLPPSTGPSLDGFLGTTVVLKGWFVSTQIPHYHHLTFYVESARLEQAP